MNKISEELDKIAASAVLNEPIFYIKVSHNNIGMETVRQTDLISYKSPIRTMLGWNFSQQFDYTTLKWRLAFNKNSAMNDVRGNLATEACEIIDRYGEHKNNKLSTLYRFHKSNLARLMRMDDEISNMVFDVIMYCKNNKPTRDEYVGIIEIFKLIKEKDEVANV